MVAIKLELLLFLNILYVTADGVRRITNGDKVVADKSYVVYLVKAPHSKKIYDEWLCGGALVSSWYIITSAACVADVEFMYAIAGYRKYVRDSEIETDLCTKQKKKKIVYTCVPMKYEFEYQKVDKWSFIDIALVKVESAYDFKDNTFKTLCSYIPTVIPISYVERFQKPGTDTLVYGWGHTKVWRQENDKINHNQEFMQFAGAKILDKPTCKTSYKMFPNMSELIDQYMICTLRKGEINDGGDLKLLDPWVPKLDGCDKKLLLNSPVLLNEEIGQSPNPSVTNDDLVCEDDEVTYQDILTDATRRGDEHTNQTSSESLQNENHHNTRKNGICQNDHGGPLVTWVGGNEILIGVASVFKVSDSFKCHGPYLYTSTQCNGAFLDCILSNSQIPDKSGRRAICNSPPIQRGYDTVERYISWKHHPSGPAENERNANANHEKEKMDTESPEAMQRLLRFNMLVKMAKDQSTAILRQQR